MSGKEVTYYRKQVLKDAKGELLEIGFGTALNLPFYPKEVKKIVTTDVNAGMNQLAMKNIKESSIEVDYHILDVQSLPFADDSFDTVVSTWTLCSIQNLDKGLEEIYRVLKPKGKFIFVEHGLSNELKIQKWQHFITPIQKVMAEGCHLNRDMENLIQKAGFRFESLTKEYAKSIPKVAGYFYYGVACK
jgi:ubiquinone/menaquinone biosynthesis C-methylase UbiE